MPTLFVLRDSFRNFHLDIVCFLAILGEGSVFTKPQVSFMRDLIPLMRPFRRPQDELVMGEEKSIEWPLGNTVRDDLLNNNISCRRYPPCPDRSKMRLKWWIWLLTLDWMLFVSVACPSVYNNIMAHFQWIDILSQWKGTLTYESGCTITLCMWILLEATLTYSTAYWHTANPHKDTAMIFGLLAASFGLGFASQLEINPMELLIGVIPLSYNTGQLGSTIWMQSIGEPYWN